MVVTSAVASAVSLQCKYNKIRRIRHRTEVLLCIKRSLVNTGLFRNLPVDPAPHGGVGLLEQSGVLHGLEHLAEAAGGDHESKLVGRRSEERRVGKECRL